MTLRPDDRITIPLARFPRDQTPRSIYRAGDERLALRPDALASLVEPRGKWQFLVLSGCWRSLDGSRRAVLDYRAGRKKLRPAVPGESLHYYGLAVDVDTEATCARLACSPDALRRLMGGAGWWWYGAADPPHYTWVGEADPDAPTLRYREGQQQLDDLWPDRRLLDYALAREPGSRHMSRLQRLLAHAGYDPGLDDGEIGRDTRAALAAFRASVLLPDNAPLARVWRCLLGCTAVVERESP